MFTELLRNGAAHGWGAAHAKRLLQYCTAISVLPPDAHDKSLKHKRIKVLSVPAGDEGGSAENTPTASTCARERLAARADCTGGARPVTWLMPGQPVLGRGAARACAGPGCCRLYLSSTTPSLLPACGLELWVRLTWWGQSTGYQPY